MSTLNTFTLDGKELERIEAFKQQHYESCRCARRDFMGSLHAGFKISFSPTNVYTYVEIECYGCNAVLDASDYDSV